MLVEGFPQPVLAVCVFQYVQQFFGFPGSVGVVSVGVVRNIVYVPAQTVGFFIELFDLAFHFCNAGLQLFFLILRCGHAGSQSLAN